jgi:hypothetical protein
MALFPFSAAIHMHSCRRRKSLGNAFQEQFNDGHMIIFCSNLKCSLKTFWDRIEMSTSMYRSLNGTYHSFFCGPDQ